MSIPLILAGASVLPIGFSLAAYGCQMRKKGYTSFEREFGAFLEVSGHFLTNQLMSDGFEDGTRHLLNAQSVFYTNKLITKDVFGGKYLLFFSPLATSLTLSHIWPKGDFLKLGHQHGAEKIEDKTAKDDKLNVDHHGHGHSHSHSHSHDHGKEQKKEKHDLFYYLSQTMYYIIGCFVAPVVGNALVAVSQISQSNPVSAFLFNSWLAVSSVSHLIPLHHINGAIAFCMYNIGSMPFIGKHVMKNKLYSDFHTWAENPGGETKVGKFYNKYVLPAWGILHWPHHMLEEMEQLKVAKLTGVSPIAQEMGEWFSSHSHSHSHSHHHHDHSHAFSRG